MSTRISRRTLLLSAAGLSVIGAKGCGGGSGTGGSDPAGGGSEPPTGTGLTGYVWYQGVSSGALFKVERGVSEPQRVNSLKDDARDSIRAFRVSTNSPRYLQMGNYGSGSQSGCMILYFDASTHTQQGFVDMNGYVVDARVSPSGRYIAMVRSPEYINTLNQADSVNIAGLTMVDISDRSKPTAIRTAFGRDSGTTTQFAWYGDDQYVYITLDGTLFGGTAAGGQTGERRMGQFSPSTLSGGEFSLHPSGKSFLINGAKASDNTDIYLCGIDGSIQRQMTAIRLGHAPLWSPDGSMFMFKWGQADVVCSDSGSRGCCDLYYAPSSVTSVTESQATKFDYLKVQCNVDHFWTAA
jgi:Tol biopolymer transport system component